MSGPGKLPGISLIGGLGFLPSIKSRDIVGVLT